MPSNYSTVARIQNTDPWSDKIRKIGSIVSSFREANAARRGERTAEAGKDVDLFLRLAASWTPDDWARNRGNLEQKMREAGYDANLAQSTLDHLQRQSDEAVAQRYHESLPDKTLSSNVFGHDDPEARWREQFETIPPDLVSDWTALGKDLGFSFKPEGGKEEKSVPLQREKVRLPDGSLKFLNFNKETGEYLDPSTGEPYTGDLVSAPRPQRDKPQGLSMSSEFKMVDKLSADWKETTAPVRDLTQQVVVMRAGVEAAARGDLPQGSQAVLVTFQKILDPTSVVRESEYARSGQSLSIAQQIMGRLERAVEGGAGVPHDELIKYARIAEDIVAATVSGSYVSAEKDRIGRVAAKYGLPPELIFEDFDYTAGAVEAIGGEGGEGGSAAPVVPGDPAPGDPDPEDLTLVPTDELFRRLTGGG